MAKIREIISKKALDIFLMDENERQAIWQQDYAVFMAEMKKSRSLDINHWTESAKGIAKVMMQYWLLDLTMDSLKKNNRAYYNRLMNKIRSNLGNTELNLGYLEKINPAITDLKNPRVYDGEFTP